MILQLSKLGTVAEWPHDIQLVLAHFYDCRSHGRWTLPRAFVGWLNACVAELKSDENTARTFPPLIARRGRKRLTVRFCYERRVRRAHLAFYETEDTTDASKYAGIGLTPREVEILEWVEKGKRDAEIATILGASRRTISNHVHRILGKLGVETRTAAVAEAAFRLHCSDGQ